MADQALLGDEDPGSADLRSSRSKVPRTSAAGPSRTRPRSAARTPPGRPRTLRPGSRTGTAASIRSSGRAPSAPVPPPGDIGPLGVLVPVLAEEFGGHGDDLGALVTRRRPWFRPFIPRYPASPLPHYLRSPTFVHRMCPLADGATLHGNLTCFVGYLSASEKIARSPDVRESRQMSEDHFQQPGWFTRNVFNKAVAGFTRTGISLMGSRVLEVKGRKSGQWRSTPVNLLEVDGRQVPGRPARQHPVGAQHARRGRRPAEAPAARPRTSRRPRSARRLAGDPPARLPEEVEVGGRRLLRRRRPRQLRRPAPRPSPRNTRSSRSTPDRA